MPPRAAIEACLADCQSFFKGCLLFWLGFLVASAPSLALDAMFLEEPPQRLAILVPDAPFTLEIIARILHGRDVPRSHRLQQACPRLGS